MQTLLPEAHLCHSSIIQARPTGRLVDTVAQQVSAAFRLLRHQRPPTSPCSHCNISKLL